MGTNNVNFSIVFFELMMFDQNLILILLTHLWFLIKIFMVGRMDGQSKIRYTPTIKNTQSFIQKWAYWVTKKGLL